MLEPKYNLKSHKLQFKEETQIIMPERAFELYVMPRLNDDGWIECSTKLKDTNMSSREWAGLILCCRTIEELTGKVFKIGKDSRDGDGVIVRHMGADRYEGIFIEQTLVTYRKHTDVTKGIIERIEAKSGLGKSYAGKSPLVIWCNISGLISDDKVACALNNSNFEWLYVLGFDKSIPGFKSIVFRKNDGQVHHKFFKFEDLLPKQA